MSVKDKISYLKARREKAEAMGGEARLEKHHAKGKLSARERIKLLFDEDSFYEIDTLNTDLLISEWRM